MTKRHWRDSIKALGNHINPEQYEQVKKTKIGVHFFSKQPQSLQYYWRLWDCPTENKYMRYKALLQVPLQCRPQHRLSWCVLPENVNPLLILPERDLDDRVAKLMKLLQHKSQSKKDGGPIFYSELIEFIYDFHRKYQTLYSLYEHLKRHVFENVYEKEDTDTSSSSSLVSLCSGSELEPYHSVQLLEKLTGDCGRLGECLVERERELCTQKREIEDFSMEVKELGEQNDGLRELILELEMTSKQREENLSNLLIKLEEIEADLMSKSEDLTEKSNDLQLGIDALWSEKDIVYQEGEIVHVLSPCKSKPELSILKVNGESSGFLFQLELLKAKFERKNMVLQKIIEEKKGIERKVKDLENQMESIMFENESLHFRVSELEESMGRRNCDVYVLAEEFEGLKNDSSTQIMALREEITNLQQELNRKEEHYENIMRGGEEVIKKLIDEKKQIQTKYYRSKLKRIEEKTEEMQEKFEESVGTSKVAHKMSVVSNKARHEVERNLDNLRGEVWKKEAEIMGLKERIWKLENDMKGLGEEKREAIRQLCVWVDYHRSQTNYLKKILSGLHAFRSQKSN